MDDTPEALGRVTLRWDLDGGSGYGELTVTASADGFAGVASAWFDNAAVLSFGEALRAFPVPSAPINLRGGLGHTAHDVTAENAHELVEELVGIQVRQVGIAGQLLVDVHLATSNSGNDSPRPLGEVRLEFVTSYGQLEPFAHAVASMMASGAGEAVLLGEPFTQDR